MKILHTADWHIGRQFHNVSLLEDQRHVLQQLLMVVEQEGVEVVIVAGDIYDRSVPPADAVNLLDQTLHTLVDDLKVPVIVISGNHDGAVRLGFGARQLTQAGLHITGPLRDAIDPIELFDAHGPVYFYPVPYMDPATVRDVFAADQQARQVQSFDDAMQFVTNRIKAYHRKQHGNSRSVVIAHCFLAGGESSDSERPLSVGGADQVSAEQFRFFNYAALGHLHQPQHKIAEHIRYAGSLLKYSFSEAEQSKSATLIEMNADGECDIRQKPLVPLRDMRIVEGEMETILSTGKSDPDNQDYLLVRLLDKTAILDPMGKLRAIYPNVLHLEKPNLSLGGVRTVFDYEAMKKNRLQLFEDFFKQMTDQELRGQQREHITKLIDDIEGNQETRVAHISEDPNKENTG